MIPAVPEPDLAALALRIRRTVIRMCAGRGQGYAGQGLGLADVMAHLYGRALRRDNEGELLDAFVLSTGHSAIALYAALHECGLYELEELETYGMDGSRIEESPLEGLPGFAITGGALGQGLSQALGLALGARLQGKDQTVYCVVSDGELQEGQVWEAIMAAAHHRVGNLVALIDNNNMQADGPTDQVLGVEPVPEKFAAFGWTALRLDAHDHGQLSVHLPHGGVERDRPLALVLDTVPGQGVSAFVGNRKAHYLRADADTWNRALAELGETRLSG